MKLLDRYKIICTVSDQGVSEAVGFIIIFSLVMIGIGLVTLYGYPILLQQQSNANVRNMERDMIILQNDIKSLVYKNVPYKETSLQVSGGSLTILPFHDILGGGSNFIISVSNNANSTDLGRINDIINDNNLTNIPLGKFRYDSDTTNEVVVMENGAVLYREEMTSGSTMLAEPRWFTDSFDPGNKTFVVTLILINSSSPMGLNGVGTIKMRVSNRTFVSPSPIDGTMTVNLEYQRDTNNDFSKAWRNYLTKSTLGLTNNPPNSNTYQLEKVKTLVINKYEIMVEGV